MKVLIVFNHPAPYKVAIFNELAKYVDLTVIFERTKAKDRPVEFYSNNKYGFKALFITKGYVGNEGNISSLVKHYIKHHFREYDHIIMNGYSHLAEIKAIHYMKKHHIRFSLMINGGIIRDNESSFKKNYKTKLISSADFYISPSKKSDEYLIYYGAKKDRIHSYPYSNLSINEFVNKPVDKGSLREKLNLPVEGKIFVNASQFIDRKNNMKLLSIFKDRKETLLLIGEGNELKKYNDFIVNNKIHNVIILPFKAKEDLFQYLRACDGFISLAKEDIFGHTIIEALANGLPVIASNKVNSALEYIKDGYNGYIVDIEDENTINKAIDEIVNINALNCVKSVKNNTFENCGKVLFDILAEENQ